MAGLATLLQLFHWQERTHIEAALPVIMGVVLLMSQYAGHCWLRKRTGVPMILGAQIVGGVVAIIVGFPLRRHAAVPAKTAVNQYCCVYHRLSLYPTAVNRMAGGAGAPGKREIELGFAHGRTE